MRTYQWISIILICLLSSITFFNETLSGSDELIKDSNQWIKQPQIYNMGAFSYEDITKYHITVNGLWNGFIGNISSPFAFGRLLEYAFEGQVYDSDKEFVEAQHAKGVYVPATILTTQGHQSLQQEHFQDFASRSVEGKLCPWDTDAESYWMNPINPGFIDWCISHGKKAIDADADMIVLDEIQGNDLILMYQWASNYIDQPVPGFSNETIEGFRQYLTNKYSMKVLSEYFDIDDINTYDLKTRIASTMHALSYYERIKADPLIVDYEHYLEYQNYEAKKHLIISLRQYAESQGKDIVITANSYALGSSQHYGFWSKGLLFADLLDMFTFENTYTAVFDQTIPTFYRTKWLAWERLAVAATNNPSVIIIDTGTMTAINEDLFPFFGFSNSMGVLCAEAYANKASFVNYYFPFFTRERNWNQVERIHQFVTENQELYEFDAEPYGNVGVVFLYGEGMRQHMNTYLGCAQALAESHIPFDVIFDGDGLYVNATLSLRDIIDFPLIIVPSLLEITDEQLKVIKNYVEQGGIACVFDGESLGFDYQHGEILYGDGLFYLFKSDVCKSYFESFDTRYRQQFSERIRSYVEDTIMISLDDRKIIVTPYVQRNEGRIILHVVNYDHIGFFDFIWPHFDIEIQLKKPNFPVSSVELRSLDGSLVYLDYEEIGGYLHCVLPQIKEYAVIVIQ